MSHESVASLPDVVAESLAFASAPAVSPLSTTSEAVQNAHKGWLITAASTNIAGLSCLAGASFVWLGLKLVEWSVNDDELWPRFTLLGLVVLCTGLGICLRYISGYAFRRSGSGHTPIVGRKRTISNASTETEEV